MVWEYVSNSSLKGEPLLPFKHTLKNHGGTTTQTMQQKYLFPLKVFLFIPMFIIYEITILGSVYLKIFSKFFHFIKMVFLIFVLCFKKQYLF